MMLRKILLVCGMLSSLLYFAGDVLLSLWYQGYSFQHQTVSELNAIGAPTRTLSIVIGLAGYALLIAFGVGIWMSAAGSRSLRVVGAVLGGLGAFSLWAVPFASMQLRGTPQEGPHLVTAIVPLILLVAAMGTGAATSGRWFRFYSIVTTLVMLVFGGWAGMDVARIDQGLATPWVGIIERISFYSWHLWFIALALVLLRRRPAGSAGRRPSRRSFPWLVP
jgi:hypothetical protein